MAMIMKPGGAADEYHRFAASVVFGIAYAIALMLSKCRLRPRGNIFADADY